MITTYKSISSDNYSVRTFNAYKEWTFTSSGDEVPVLLAQDTLIYNPAYDTVVVKADGTTFEYNKHSLYGQLSASFYSQLDTPTVLGHRKLGSSAKVLSIPVEYIGEGIKQGTLTITDDATSKTLTDNRSGSLMDGTTVVGDIFYGNGIVVYTDTSTVNTAFTSTWSLTFRSTQTITEHEIFVSVDKTEFNVSRNPTALYTTGTRTVDIVNHNTGRTETVVTFPGNQFIRKRTVSPTGTVYDYRYGSRVNAGISGGFEHYYVSSSVDVTGSFLTPFVTTIGLYDNDNDLVAVAKLPRPIKMEPNLPINFIVRFDA